MLIVKSRRPPFFDSVSGQIGQNTRRGEPRKDRVISVLVFRAMLVETQFTGWTDEVGLG